MEEDLDYANTCLIGYQEMFQTPPKGYVANTKLSSFTIPVREGHSVPAKWVKQLDDGQVTGYGESNGEGDLPYVIEIYAEPSYSSTDLPEVFPHWLSKTLQGTGTHYYILQEVVKSIGNWGLYTKVVWYRDLDEQVLHYKAQLNLDHAHMHAAQAAHSQCITRLKGA